MRTFIHRITWFRREVRAYFETNPLAFPRICCFIVGGRGFLTGDSTTMTFAFLMGFIVIGLEKSLGTIASDQDQDKLSYEIREKIMGMVRAKGWSEGAKAIPQVACESAITFLESIKSQRPNVSDPKSVAPSAMGAISLYWEKERAQLLIEISANPSRVYYQMSAPGTKYSHGWVSFSSGIAIVIDFFSSHESRHE